jgi:hypothetical protein
MKIGNERTARFGGEGSISARTVPDDIELVSLPMIMSINMSDRTDR